MKTILRIGLLAAMLTGVACGQDNVDRTLVDILSHGPGWSDNAPPPTLDPQRIINESNSFLKEREPEMTAEEYAIYEKVETMLTANVDLAVKMLEGMINDKEPPSPAFAFILGNAYYASNQLDRAEKSYRDAVKRYPAFLRAWTNLGVLYYTSGRYEEAAASFSKAVALGDHEPSTLGLLGFSLEKQGDVISAEMAYLQALGGDPTNTDWKEGLLRIYIAGKQYGRAEPLVRALIKAKPGNTGFWLDYAGILLAQQRKTEAMVVLEESVAFGAAGPDELLLLGDLYAERNLTSDAAAAYAKVLGLARPRGEQKLLQFARILIAAGKLTEAEQVLAKIKGEVTPSGQVALLQARAELQMARKNWVDARRELNQLLELEPLNGRALLSLGRTYLEQNDLPHATLSFEAAYRVADSTYQACIDLANVELRNRHFAKAVEYLEKAQSIEKSDAVADYLAQVRPLLAHESK